MSICDRGHKEQGHRKVKEVGNLRIQARNHMKRITNTKIIRGKRKITLYNLRYNEQLIRRKSKE